MELLRKSEAQMQGMPSQFDINSLNLNKDLGFGNLNKFLMRQIEKNT